MSNARLNDKGGSILIKSLERCRNLVKLNLSENELSNMSGEALQEYFEFKNTVEELMIHNNAFNSNNLKSFLLNLNNQKKLSTLDLSWNKIGTNGEIFKKFAVNLNNNDSLHHLDISHNHINKTDIEELSKNVRNNQVLIGLHLAGNEGSIDGCGYIHPIDDNITVMNSFNERGLGLQFDQ